MAKAAAELNVMEKIKTIVRVCEELSIGNVNCAKEIIRKEYPHSALNLHKRKYNEYQSTKIFIRDGFIDRYSGRKLIYPPVLRIISLLIPEEFPFHKNWKMTECHIAYWQLLPTIDHVVPIARGGKDEESNLVTTSMLRNSAKSNWLLKELGWKLYPPGKFSEWDGLMNWFINFCSKNNDILSEPYIFRWYRAALKSTEKIILC